MESRDSKEAADRPRPELQLLSVLGYGSFSVVFLARQESRQQNVAVKVFRQDVCDPFNIKQTQKEAGIMQLLNHENILQLLEVCHVQGHRCLVLELADRGTLYDLVMGRGGLPEPKAMALFKQILAAVSHCHAQRVAHRDLKLDNLLLNSDHRIKLSDFGFSCHLAEGGLVHDSCGMPLYTAPEVFQPGGYDPFPADVWSLGVILFTMMAGAVPFSGEDEAELTQNIRRGYYELPCPASPALEELLSSLLSLDPRERPSAEEAKHHPWFNTIGEELEHEALTQVWSLGVAKDPEDQNYPSSGASTTSSSGQPRFLSLETHSQSLEQMRPYRQSAPVGVPTQHNFLVLQGAPLHANFREVWSAPALLNCEPMSPQGCREPKPKSEEHPEERSPGASPAPGSTPVAASSTPSSRSSGDPVEPEDLGPEPEPELEPEHEEAETSAAASVRKGFGRILRILLCACCLPDQAKPPGPRRQKVVPQEPTLGGSITSEVHDMEPEPRPEQEPKRESPTTDTLVASLHLALLKDKRSPGASAAPEPIPVATSSTPCPRGRGDPVVQEVPAPEPEPEPEEVEASAATSVRSKGRQGVGRRLLQRLWCACCKPTPAKRPGLRSRKVMPQ
ncbi:serine/threonine-protein kinase MARK2 [Oryctolagus cuniculus]|uniref:serine/threonine-protein kinase MARK2 n=1 Tax=Oryctolagus cuniculus TaxID=9986 RepID=UPI00387A6A64